MVERHDHTWLRDTVAVGCMECLDRRLPCVCVRLGTMHTVIGKRADVVQGARKCVEHCSHTKRAIVLDRGC